MHSVGGLELIAEVEARGNRCWGNIMRMTELRFVVQVLAATQEALEKQKMWSAALLRQAM